MSSGRVNTSMLVVAIMLLLPALGGLALALNGGGPLGWALLGFFGAGAVVLGRKAVTGG
jgi:hypothetical protein